MKIRNRLIAALLLASAAPALTAPPVYDERPAKLAEPTAYRDYDRRSIDIPMRDGVKLHTVIMVPKAAKGAAILLTRTPYNAEELTSIGGSGHFREFGRLLGVDGPVRLHLIRNDKTFALR